VQRNNFQIILLIAIEMAVLSVFSQKNGLGPLEVNINYKRFTIIRVLVMSLANLERVLFLESWTKFFKRFGEISITVQLLHSTPILSLSWGNIHNKGIAT